ncbi:MAG: lysophospholipid acyltransferase family protein [Desulfatibacillaceae bacterium]
MLRRTILKKLLVSPDFEQQMNRVPKEVGSLGYDAWGYHKDGGKIGLSLLKLLYDHWFRVEPQGLENIPAKGRVLVIANHSGQIPFDGGLVMIAMVTNPHAPRMPRTMIERWFPTLPYVNNILNMGGAVLGDPMNCERMLEHEEAVIVFPEGVRGSGKLFYDRYELQRFGNGFMHLAIEHDAPIVPVGVVGCEESMPSLADIKPLARLLGFPYAPLTIPAPLPVKVRLYFGEPMRYAGPVESEQQVAGYVEEVKDAIRGLIRTGLSERKGWFK